MTERPKDASGEYTSFQGLTWIKDLDAKDPKWPLARVWSHTTKRWRKKRQMIAMDRIRLFDAN